MALFEEPEDELRKTPYRSRSRPVMYESPVSILRERGSRMLSYIERSLTPTTRQLERLEEDDLEDHVKSADAEVTDPVEDGAEAEEQVQDPNLGREIAINGEVFQI